SPDLLVRSVVLPFFFHAEDGIRGRNVTGVQTCALPISLRLRVCCLRAIIIPPFPYLFFLIRNCFIWTFTGAGIVFSLLSTNRESTTVANTSVRCDFNQTIDVKVLFMAHITYDLVALTTLADFVQFIFSKIPYASAF